MAPTAGGDGAARALDADAHGYAGADGGEAPYARPPLQLLPGTGCPALDEGGLPLDLQVSCEMLEVLLLGTISVSILLIVFIGDRSVCTI